MTHIDIVEAEVARFKELAHSLRIEGTKEPGLWIEPFTAAEHIRQAFLRIAEAARKEGRAEREGEIREKYLGWVTSAVCPECDGSGAYYVGSDDDPQVQQCQWCDYKRQLTEVLSPTPTTDRITAK